LPVGQIVKLDNRSAGSGFTAARLAYKPENLAFVNVETNVVHRFDNDFSFSKTAAKIQANIF
jgi:hypothetical protein